MRYFDMDTINVCIIAPEFLPVWGGVGTYTVELVRHLPKEIQIHVVTPIRESFGEAQVSTSDYNFSDYFDDNVHVHFVSKASDTFLFNASYQLACSTKVPRIIREEKIDIVHLMHHMAGLLLELKGVKVPTVTTVHNTVQLQRDGTKMSGMPFFELGFNEKATYLTYPILRLIETMYFSGKRNYISVSNWMTKQLWRDYPGISHSPISIIHNSVDTELFSPSNKRKHDDRDIVLFTGRIIAAKGINYLVDAIPKVLKEHPDTLFTFIGAGDSEPYEKRLKQTGVSDNNFEFLGYLKDRNDLIDYYRDCSVYVAPTTLWENLPIRVLEAMSCGAPVVASEVCAIPEAIDNSINGILITQGSIDELAGSICDLISDPSLRKRIGDNARKTALDKFDYKINALRTAKVYDEIIS
jgi:glycosyltransferase involved in cell wall biosynthesis